VLGCELNAFLHPLPGPTPTPAPGELQVSGSQFQENEGAAPETSRPGTDATDERARPPRIKERLLALAILVGLGAIVAIVRQSRAE
jgi:hypothetical protein